MTWHSLSRLILALSISLFPASAPAVQADEAEDFFDPGTVQAIRLGIAPADLDRLRWALPRRIAVPGTFQWQDQPVRQVRIRYKGNSSSPPDWSFKRSFLVSFDDSDPDARFLGLRRVALDNGIQFGGLFSERLITEALRGVGVKASRCNHAWVHLNGRSLGVYVNVERIDQPFLARNFASDRGPLFKVDEGGPGADLAYLGEDPSAYRGTFELHSKDDGTAHVELLRLLRALQDPRGNGDALERWIDVDAFLKATAVLLLSGAFDQYTGWSPHNYYLYRNPVDGRWTYLPWDLDVGFADDAFGRIPVLQGWHAAWPAPVPGRPLMERVVSDPELLARYRRHARQILEAWFNPEILIPRLRAMHAQIRPALAADPHPLRRVTVPSDSGIDDAIASMEQFIRDRYALAKAQLDAPGPRPAFTPPSPEAADAGPSPGPASPDAPTGLRATRIGPDRVELRWTDHAEGEVAHVVQRCEGTDCDGFQNAIGQAGGNVTSATDRNVRPGQTYRYRVYAVLPTARGPRGTGVSNEISVTLPAPPIAPD